MTVGYIVGAKTSDPVSVECLKEQAKFEVTSFVLDFPKIEGFKDMIIPPQKPKSIEGLSERNQKMEL